MLKILSVITLLISIVASAKVELPSNCTADLYTPFLVCQSVEQSNIYLTFGNVGTYWPSSFSSHGFFWKANKKSCTNFEHVIAGPEARKVLYAKSGKAELQVFGSDAESVELIKTGNKIQVVNLSNFQEEKFICSPL